MGAGGSPVMLVGVRYGLPAAIVIIGLALAVLGTRTPCSAPGWSWSVWDCWSPS